MSEGPKGVFKGIARGLSLAGLCVEAVGIAQDDTDIATAGQKLRQAAREVPELQREAASGLPDLGGSVGRKLGKGLFDILTAEDEP